MLTNKKINALLLIIAFVTLISMWIIPKIFSGASRNQTNKGVQKGDNNKVFQFGDNFKGNIYYFSGEDSKKEIDRLKEENKQLKDEIIVPFQYRPKVIIVDPTVTFVNYTDEVAKGLVKAGFDIRFLNIGKVEAKDIITTWNIYDNGNRITGLNEWLTKYLKREPLVIKTLEPNRIVSLLYNPDIGANGVGTLEFILDYEYTDAKTGEKYLEQYKGFIDYKTERNNKPKMYSFSPL